MAAWSDLNGAIIVHILKVINKHREGLDVTRHYRTFRDGSDLGPTKNNVDSGATFVFP
jgi:hypothetical protein